MRHHIKCLFVLGFAFVAAACTVKAIGDPEKPITIKAHIVIDVRELKSTATNIEDQVAAQAQATQVSPTQPTKVSLLSIARRWMEPELAYAEGGYDLKEITPQVQAALNGRSSRYRQLAGMKAIGKVGEDNEGHVKNLCNCNNVDALVSAENRDREVIYQAIVTQNNLPANSIYTVRSVFADVQNEKAKPGEKVQLQNGEWVTKS